MIRRLLPLLLALLWATAALAQSPVIGNGIISPTSTTGPAYAPLLVLNPRGSQTLVGTALNYTPGLAPQGGLGTAWNPTARPGIIPLAVKLQNLVVRGEAAVTAGQSFTLTVMKNGAATALQCYINSTNQICSCNPNAPQNCSTGGTSGIDFLAGDTVSIQSCPQTNDPPTLTGNTCAAVGTATGVTADIDLLAQSATNDLPIFGWSNAGLTNSGAGTFNSFGASNGNLATDAIAADIIPSGNGGSGVVGTINDFYAYASTVPPGASSWAVTVYQNGSPTAITCTVDNTHNPCSDLAHSITVSAGDTVSIQTVPSGSPTGTFMNFSSNWRSTTWGEYPIFGQAGILPQATGARWVNLSGNGGIGYTNYLTSTTITPAATSITVKGPSLSISTAPGSTYSRTGTVVSGSTPAGQTASSVTCSITAAVTTCSQSPSTTLTVTGSTPSQAQFFNWNWNCSNASCAAITWAKMSAITTVVP